MSEQATMTFTARCSECGVATKFNVTLRHPDADGRDPLHRLSVTNLGVVEDLSEPDASSG